MATTKADLFHDDLMALLRKYGIEDAARTRCHALRDAVYELVDEAEKVLDARAPAHSCDHCGALVTLLYAQREPKGGLIAVCGLCRDGIANDLAERDDPANGPNEHAFNAWANRGMARR